MSVFLWNVLKIVLVAAIIVITKAVMPWLSAATSNSQMATVLTLVEQAVMYAQQWLTDSTGEQKKAVVMNLLYEILEERGIAITYSELNTLVEAAVLAVKDQYATDAAAESAEQ